MISRTRSRAIALSVSVISRSWIQRSAARADISVYSWIEIPPTLTARLSGRNLAPLQTGQGCSAM